MWVQVGLVWEQEWVRELVLLVSKLLELELKLALERHKELEQGQVMV